MELRKDYFLDRWVALAPKRKKRPRSHGLHKGVSKCSFCPGMESLTPPETGRVGGRKWSMRWFPNLYPAFEEKCQKPVKQKQFFVSAPSFGRHEMIVETPVHEKQLWDFATDEIALLLRVYDSRIKELGKIKGIKYVVVFKNHGAEAGASLAHSHSQVAAIGFVPKEVSEKVSAASRFGRCLYCNVISKERAGKRLCFENKHAIAFAPYASRFNYEAWIFPKRHVRAIAELDEKELRAMSGLVAKILRRLKSINAPYNMFVQYSPKGKDLHFHIEITPRTSVWAGFEFASGTVINSLTPEEAASFYRKKG